MPPDRRPGCDVKNHSDPNRREQYSTLRANKPKSFAFTIVAPFDFETRSLSFWQSTLPTPPTAAPSSRGGSRNLHILRIFRTFYVRSAD